MRAVLNRRNIVYFGAVAVSLLLAGVVAAVLWKSSSFASYTCGDLTKAVNDSVYFTSVHGGHEQNPYEEKSKAIYAYALDFAKTRFPKSSSFAASITDSPLGLITLCQAEGSDKPITDMVSLIVRSNPDDYYSDERTEKRAELEKSELDEEKDHQADRVWLASLRAGAVKQISHGQVVTWNPVHSVSPQTYAAGNLRVTLAVGLAKVPNSEFSPFSVIMTLRQGTQEFSKEIGITGRDGGNFWFSLVHLDPDNAGDQILVAGDEGSGNAHLQDITLLEFTPGGGKGIDFAAERADSGILPEVMLPKDRDGDGIPDILGNLETVIDLADSHADQWEPPVIYNLVNGNLRDVTALSEFGRKLLIDDMTLTKRGCELPEDAPERTSENTKIGSPHNGACGAYVLDALRLDRGRLFEAVHFAAEHVDSPDAFVLGCKVPLGKVNYQCPEGQEKWHTWAQALIGTLEEAGYVTHVEAQSTLAQLPQHSDGDTQ